MSNHDSIRCCARCGNNRPGRARGLCNGCYTTLWQRGDLADYPTRCRKLADVIEDWQFLAATGESREQAAARMGMTRASLDSYISRARRLGLLEKVTS